MKRTLLYICCFLYCFRGFGQEYNYTHYSIRDGLPSNTIYDVKQDIDGFLWIATDAGVSRFDGKEFVNFSMEDGLPTMDVLQVFPDSKGRVWMGFVLNTTCYFYNGKIYNKTNDTNLSKLQLPCGVTCFSNNDLGEVLINAFHSTRDGSNKSYLLKANNQLQELRYPDDLKWIWSVERAYSKSGFLFSELDTATGSTVIHAYEDGQWSKWLKMAWNPATKHLNIYKFQHETPLLIDSMPQSNRLIQVAHTFSDRKIKLMPVSTKQYNTHSLTRHGLHTYMLSTNNGAYLIDSIDARLLDYLLPDKKISRGFIDVDRNIWLPTLGEGLYKLPSREFHNYNFKNRNKIYSINKSGNKIFAGSEFSNLHLIHKNKPKTLNFDKLTKNANNNNSGNRLVSILPINNHSVILGFDSFLMDYNPLNGTYKTSRTDVIKSVSLISNDSLLLATGRACMIINRQNLEVLDTIFRMRSYSAIAVSGNYYIGTSNGLYKIRKDRSYWYMGNATPALQNLVNHLAVTSDGSLWASTYGSGVVQLKNDKVVNHFTTTNGLSSNTCKSLYADGKFIWVGTEKGLNRIDRINPLNPIRQYTVLDGLASNDVLSLFGEDSTIYAGTDAGITFFNPYHPDYHSSCNLKLLDVQIDRQSINPDSLQSLFYEENNLRFTFTGISFRSIDDIKYFYRLKGLKDSWDSTRNDFLEFLALQPGDYALEIFAQNKYGVKSNTLSIPFQIQPPFWNSWWFRFVAAFLIFSIAWLFIVRRIRQEKEKGFVQNRINELEQMALRSQMNPHFIFNCLNSIQNFLIQNDFEKTNEYLTSFAHIIRQTLDNSGRPMISIDDECRYLTNYLELESMRFRNSFQHSIEVDPAIDGGSTFIPTMILQPYVENSIRHGLRYRKDGTKNVLVRFIKQGNTLICMVEDDGVGRKKSAELKSFVHVEYQSKGMVLTAERISALNKRRNPPITVEIVDMEEDGKATGTRVVLRFPNTFA